MTKCDLWCKQVKHKLIDFMMYSLFKIQIRNERVCFYILINPLFLAKTLLIRCKRMHKNQSINTIQIMQKIDLSNNFKNETFVIYFINDKV